MQVQEEEEKLETVSRLRRFGIHARDGDLGRVVDLFFDDETWTTRYLVVETGSWLRRRRVLISPIAITGVDETARTVYVDLTRAQIAAAPPVETHIPLSRQMELKYRDYFSWPLYWLTTYLDAYGSRNYPRLAAADRSVRSGRTPRRERVLPGPPRSDRHLRSASRTHGYAIMTLNGLDGRLEDFAVDSEDWTVRYVVARVPHEGKVLLPKAAVVDIDWPMSAVHLNISRSDLHHAAPFQAAHA